MCIVPSGECKCTVLRHVLKTLVLSKKTNPMVFLRVLLGTGFYCFFAGFFMNGDG